jgi:hypothetical protein
MSAKSALYNKLAGQIVVTIIESVALGVALVVAAKLSGDDVKLDQVVAHVKQRFADIGTHA